MAKKEKAAEAAATSEKTAFRFSEDATINFGTDDKGVAYSAENSPKKGDNTKARWANYQDGMTVKDALATGMTRSNIRKDRRAGYVTVTNPPEAPKTDAPAE